MDMSSHSNQSDILPSLPTRAPAVHMTWADIAFAHWRVPVEAMRRLVPAELEVDTHDGDAWVGLIPFKMQDCSFRGVPPLPGLRNFLECNVRTYVRHRGIPGVWFFSLDAESRIGVIGGRVMWGLNYRLARFQRSMEGETIRYGLDRNKGDGSGRLDWTPGKALPAHREGSLEHFLVERYHLYSLRRGRLIRGRVDHPPWDLQQATVEALDPGLVRAAGIEVRGEPVVHCSRGVRVRGFSPVPADRTGD
ncbi:MAG: hypothetical protein CMJ34_04445 [Phycisphaerae bacterium]|nr:hypothetical protein [Phycisphaerae bacterium]